MDRTYCYRCATKLEPREQYAWWCPHCQFVQYANPAACVEIVLFYKGKILASERAQEPRKGTYDMPGGFVDVGESLEEALLRELKEELGLDKNNLSTPVYLRSFSIDYPWPPEVYQLTGAVFAARLLNDIQVEAHDDVASIKWVGAEEVDQINWSSPEHTTNAYEAFKLFANH